MKKSGEFYNKLFGWKIDYSWSKDYAVFGTGEGQLSGGGLDRKDKIISGNIIIYLLVDDINAMLEKAVRLGAKKVKERTENPDVGWFGLFTDLDGNTIGLFTPKNRPTPLFSRMYKARALSNIPKDYFQQTVLSVSSSYPLS